MGRSLGCNLFRHILIHMKIDPFVTAKFQTLVEFGNRVLSTKRQSPTFGSSVDSDMSEEWFVSTISFISRIMGEDSEHYRAIRRHQVAISRLSSARSALAVLKAAQTDYNDGYLINVRRAIAAEVFDDFLEQAEHFLANGDFAVAAVIAGCVLEDGLRKLCDRNGIQLSDKPKLNSMNTDLAKAGVYELTTSKKVIWLADLRNKAAHGQWDTFKKEDAEEMVTAVRRFMEDHFA